MPCPRCSSHFFWDIVAEGRANPLPAAEREALMQKIRDTIAANEATRAADISVHLTHCCPFGCKYGDADCPVATQGAAPTYACEDCFCAFFYPDLGMEAEIWWSTLSPAVKRRLYRFETMGT